MGEGAGDTGLLATPGTGLTLARLGFFPTGKHTPLAFAPWTRPLLLKHLSGVPKPWLTNVTADQAGATTA